MSLIAGTRLGPYEIVSTIGAGGMGEVYRARDTKLDRDVAIKVLPASFAADPDRVARFTREAKTLASLNHPNIAHIHEMTSGVISSAGGGDMPPEVVVRALVMELVEGDDLSQRLSRGAIPIDEALPIARQIADALETAHEQGIVHRDLKPANIKVRADGTVKVLDFGLAKAMSTADESSSRSSFANSPTVTSPAHLRHGYGEAGTAIGVILGTAAYMSPEQAKGKVVDKRTDIWAFGVVLYEMISGRRAFQGDDVPDLLVAVLSKDVDLAALANAPRPLVDLIRRCLVRDSKHRLRDIGDARIALDAIIAGAPGDGATATATATTRSSSSAWPWVIAGALALALGVAVWAPWRIEKPVDRPLVRLDVDLGEDVALPASLGSAGSNIAISPDGTRIAYVSGPSGSLFTRRLDQPKATELAGTGGATFPFFSTDGLWIGFSANRRINRISVEGGTPIPLGQAALTGAASFADGSILASEAFARGLLRFPAAGGSPSVVVPAGAGSGGMVVPQILPGEKAAVLAACSGGGADTCNIEGVTLADGHRKNLVRGGHSPHYVSAPDGTGYLIYVNKATLFAIAFDATTLETRGAAVPILDDVGYAARTGAGFVDVSRTGTLIYRRTRAGALSATLQWIDAGGRTSPLRDRPATYGPNVILSPDGKRIALTIIDGANEDIWAYDLERDALTRLTSGGSNSLPMWSPDGQYVVFGKLALGLFQVRSDGASPPQLLIGGKNIAVAGSFTPDGKQLAYSETAGTSQIWTVPIEDQGSQLKAGTPKKFLESSFSDSQPSISPDGRWLAYVSNESGTEGVYVRPFSAPVSGQGRKWPISNNGGTAPHWSPATHELLYHAGGALMAVKYSVTGDTFVAEKPRVWIEKLGAAGWDLAHDGKRVVALIPEVSGQATRPEHEIVMLLNFGDELRRKIGK